MLVPNTRLQDLTHNTPIGSNVSIQNSTVQSASSNYMAESPRVDSRLSVRGKGIKFIKKFFHLGEKTKDFDIKSQTSSKDTERDTGHIYSKSVSVS